MLRLKFSDSTSGPERLGVMSMTPKLEHHMETNMVNEMESVIT